MPDKYASFDQLFNHERNDAYRIDSTIRHSAIALMAPHGGKIEPGTSEICRAIAGDTLTLYLFEGRKTASNSDLHITSTHFDEPRALAAARSAKIVVTIHGQTGDKPFVNVGGRHEALRKTLIDALNAAGYDAFVHPDARLQGLDLNNLCNRGETGRGVQLEVSRALRDRLRANVRELDEFSTLMRETFRGHT